MRKIFFILCFSITLSNGILAQPFVVGQTSGKLVTYNDFNPNIQLWYEPSNYFCNIDIDFDSFSDLSFKKIRYQGHFYETYIFSVYAIEEIQFVYMPDSDLADSLSLGTIVDKNLNWDYKDDGAVLYYNQNVWFPGGHNTTYGICTKPSVYIGFRKFNYQDTVYGWFSIENGINSFAINRKIHYEANREILHQNHNIIICPNPANKYFKIRSDTNNICQYHLVIYSANGQIALIKDIEFQQEYIIDIGSLKRGLYIISLVNEKEKIIKKLIVE